METYQHQIREQVCNGKIRLKYCPTEDMLADIFTKESDLRNSKGSEDYVECAIKCQVRKSVEGMHSPQFTHAHRTQHVITTCVTLKHSRTFFFMYIFIVTV